MGGLKTAFSRLAAATPQIQALVQKLRRREQVFERAYNTRAWGSSESGSGIGSELQATENLRSYLPKLLARLNVRNFLDAPCGDWNWMRTVDLGNIDYTGVDVVSSVIDENSRRYASPTIRFIRADLTKDRLPRAELILCRDCWIHLSYQDMAAMLENFRQTGATWLLLSDSPSIEANANKFTGLRWRHLNLSLAPFHFPPAEERRSDHYESEPFQISLWRIADLPRVLLD